MWPWVSLFLLLDVHFSYLKRRQWTGGVRIPWNTHNPCQAVSCHDGHFWAPSSLTMPLHNHLLLTPGSNTRNIQRLLNLFVSWRANRAKARSGRSSFWELHVWFASWSQLGGDRVRKSVQADCWDAGINTGQVALETWKRPSVKAGSAASLSGNSKCSIKGQIEPQWCGNRSWVCWPWQSLTGEMLG